MSRYFAFITLGLASVVGVIFGFPWFALLGAVFGLGWMIVVAEYEYRTGSRFFKSREEEAAETIKLRRGRA